jgi:hypothetical protein
MTLEQLLKWWPAVAFFLNAGALWVMWSMRQQFITRREFAELEDRVNAIDAKVSNLATKDDIHQVLIRLEHSEGERKALAATVGGIDDKLSRIEKPLDLIQDYLLRERR